MDYGKLLIALLAGLANTPDGRQRLMDILQSRQPIGSLATLAGVTPGVAEVVTALEAFVACLTNVGADEARKRLSGTSTDATAVTLLRRIDATTAATRDQLLAIPECKAARLEQITLEVFTVLAPHFDGADKKLKAFAETVAAEHVEEGKSVPTPDQLVARAQQALAAKPARATSRKRAKK